MAKSRALAQYRPPVIVVPAAPRGGLARRRSRGIARARGRGRRHSKRGGAHKGGFSTSMAIPAIVGSAAVGWIGAKGYLAKLPEIAGSRMNTLGLVGYALMRFTKHPGIKAAGFGALCVSAFNFGRLQGGGGIAGDDASGLDDVSGDVEGDDILGEGSSAY